MPTTINGSTGVSQVQDNIITSAKIVDGSVAQADLDNTNKLLQAKAWVCFDGTLTGTITPRAHSGIPSVTKTATGAYTLNIAAGVLADANYVAVGNTNVFNSNGQAYVGGVQLGASAKTTTALSVVSWQAAGQVDASQIYIVIFGN